MYSGTSYVHISFSVFCAGIYSVNCNFTNNNSVEDNRKYVSYSYDKVTFYTTVLRYRIWYFIMVCLINHYNKSRFKIGFLVSNKMSH